MKILFGQGIVRAKVHIKKEVDSYECSHRVVRNYKRRIGYKFLIFPIYEIIEAAVVRDGWSSVEYYCDLKDYVRNDYYFENDILYSYPYCYIELMNGKYEEVYFKNEELLKEFVERLKAFGAHIIL